MRDFKFWVDLLPRFSDLDAFGHVNNAVYLTYLEEARAAYCRELDIFFSGQKALSFVIARAELDYKSPVGYGQELRVALRSENWTRRGFDFVYRIDSPARKRVVLTGRTACVCWQVEEARPVDLPAEYRAAMEKFETGRDA
ncbi:MAG: acyl-CoA thioesterase [Deltaproteobacteria bacterium]|nr:acyl-CoA thioesterase [Deltaproteobacteria bacterium]